MRNRAECRAAFFRFHDVTELKPNDLVELTDGWSEHIGSACLVLSVDGTIAMVRLVDDQDEWFAPIGAAFPAHVGSLVLLPNRTQIRAGKRRAREQHLAAKRAQGPNITQSPGNIRHFKQDW